MARAGPGDPDRAVHGPARVSAEATPGSPSRSLPGVTWELPGRALSRSLWPMDQDIALVGRSPACQLRIVETDVSKFHCSLVRTHLGVWVVDLLGREGVFVNDRAGPLRQARGRGRAPGRPAQVIRPRYDSPPAPLPSRTVEVPANSARGSPDPGAAPAWAGGEVSTFLERPAGLADPTVAALVQQFGLMQQQMFDQFHHTMMMMFEGFAAIHRETSGTLREEFERVRELSREIEALRVETTRLAEAATRPGPEAHARPPCPLPTATATATARPIGRSRWRTPGPRVRGRPSRPGGRRPRRPTPTSTSIPSSSCGSRPSSPSGRTAGRRSSG